MVIQIDSREKQKAIKSIVSEFDRNGIKHISSKLYVGDYMNLEKPTTIIDRKQNLFEVANNVCQDHARFRKELIKATDAGIHLIFLVEHGYGIDCLEDVQNWQNPRLKESPLAVSGERLYKILSTMKNTYDFDIEFCQKKDTGKRIIEILT